MSHNEIDSEKLSLEIRVAVAEDELTAERARLERCWREQHGFSYPLRAAQFRAMNRVVDFQVLQSKQAAELTAARGALKAYLWKIVRMKAGYLA